MVELGIPREECQACYDAIGDRWKEWGQLAAVPADFGQRAQEIEARSAAAAAATAPLGEEPAMNPRQPAHPGGRRRADLAASSCGPCSSVQGHQVVTASNGHEALARALADPPQMVVTDWMMPGMDGVELCKRLRSTRGRSRSLHPHRDGPERGAAHRRGLRGRRGRPRPEALQPEAPPGAHPSRRARHQADRGAPGREPPQGGREPPARDREAPLQGGLDDRRPDRAAEPAVTR